MSVIYEQKIDLPYSYTAGAVQRAALTGLREARLVGSRAPDGRVFVPAKPFAPDGTALEETVELPAEGTLEAVTVAHHLDGAPAFGLIRIEGAENLLLHRLGGGAERLERGVRVRAVWREERSGSIADVEFFAPMTARR